MRVLAIDSAGRGCAACLWRDGAVVSFLSEDMARGQDARLMPMVLDVMRASNATFKELDRVAVVKGPGSFTGLRIGLAAGRAIALTVDVPTFGVDRFTIHEVQQKEKGQGVLVALDSRRLELYTRFYSVDGVPQKQGLMTLDEIGAFARAHPDVLVAGDAADILGNHVPSARLMPLIQAEVLTAAALAAGAAKDDPAFTPKPFYLRPPDVTFAKENT